MKNISHPFAFMHAHNPALPLGALVLLGLLFAQNSAWAQSPTRPQPPVFSALPPTLALTHAVIERVLHDTGEIVLDHEDLPNLGMPPMTMAFEVSSKEMLEAFKAGDKVRFQAEIVAGRPTITRLERAP